MKEIPAMPSRSDQRKFQRILLDAPTSIRTGIQQLSCNLIDISLKGVLVTRPDNWPSGGVDDADVSIKLDDGETQIRMRVTLVHTEPECLGFRCRHIDIDSISHLRRLVELNLEDPDLLERQLHALIHHR